MDDEEMKGMMKDSLSRKRKKDAPMSKSQMKMKGNQPMDGMAMDKDMDMGGMKMGYMIPDDKVVGDNMKKTGANPEFNYNYLRALEKTGVQCRYVPCEEMPLLDGKYERLCCSMNGVPLSEQDYIR